MARSLGLISYYRGGGEELMPRTTRNEIVRVPFSEYAFAEYARARAAELEMESTKEKPKEGEAATATAAKKRKGMTVAEMDLYAQATQSPQSGFLTLSRAACNWVWPQEVERPTAASLKEAARLRGLDQDRLIAADMAADTDLDMEEGALTATGAEVNAEATAAAVIEDEPVAETAPVDDKTSVTLNTVMSSLEAHPEFLRDGLAQFSPKYAEILGRIRASPGPALVYSQFKTLEGLGIFAAALRAAPEGYIALDLERGSDGQWRVPEAMMAPGRPRYILYTGDQDLEKRRLLLQMYNADVAGLPPALSAQCATLLAGAPDNRDGRVARIFMITQSGAEGISLFNTRQVHIMEPYWNNVRLQQVIGRAIRLCSHMNLPWADRTVDVYTYLSVFSDAQKSGDVKGAKEVMIADRGKTTDETIFEIAIAKQKLADGLQSIAQRAAIDCELHFHEHGAVTQCFKYAGDVRPSFLHHPDINRDVAAVGIVAAGK